MSQMFVAEPGEDGSVAWVWYWHPELRGPRALQRRSDIVGDPEDGAAEFHGAPKGEILNWINARLHETA
jgi:hypothetical protein